MAGHMNGDSARLNRGPACAGKAIFRGMDGVARPLTGKVCDVQRDGLIVSIVVVVPNQKISRAELIQNIFVQGPIDRVPALEGTRKRGERRTLGNNLGAIASLQQQGSAGEQHCGNQESPVRFHAETSAERPKTFMNSWNINKVSKENTNMSQPENS